MFPCGNSVKYIPAHTSSFGIKKGFVDIFLGRYQGREALPDFANYHSHGYPFQKAPMSIIQRHKKVGKKFEESKAISLHLYLKKQSKSIPSKGAILLFGKNRTEIFLSSLEAI